MALRLITPIPKSRAERCSYLLLRSFCQFPIIETFYTRLLARPTSFMLHWGIFLYSVLNVRSGNYLPSLLSYSLSLYYVVLPMDPMVLDPRSGCLAQIQFLPAFPQGPSAPQLHKTARQHLSLTPSSCQFRGHDRGQPCVFFSHCNSPLPGQVVPGTSPNGELGNLWCGKARMLGVRSVGRQTVVTCLESDPGRLNRACSSQGRLYLTPQAACCYLFIFIWWRKKLRSSESLFRGNVFVEPKGKFN